MKRGHTLLIQQCKHLFLLLRASQIIYTWSLAVRPTEKSQVSKAQTPFKFFVAKMTAHATIWVIWQQFSCTTVEVRPFHTEEVRY